LEDPFGQISVDAEPQPLGGRRYLHRHLALGREPAAGPGGFLGDLLRICRPALTARLVAGRSNERVDRSRKLIRVALDQLERSPILVGLAVATEREL
jgi:hypothetical protein